MSCLFGLKAEMIRLRVIPCSRLRSRERMLPGPSHVCLPEARGRFSSGHRNSDRPHRKMWLRWLHCTNSKVGRDVAGHLYIILEEPRFGGNRWVQFPSPSGRPWRTR